jgi:hypothetical protein
MVLLFAPSPPRSTMSVISIVCQHDSKDQWHKRVRNWYCSPPPRLYLAPTSAHQGESRRSLLFDKGTRRATSRRMRREWQAQHAWGTQSAFGIWENTRTVRVDNPGDSRREGRCELLGFRLVLNLTDLFKPVQTSPSPELHQLARYSDVTSSKLGLIYRSQAPSSR